MDKVNLAEKFGQIKGHYKPGIVARYNENEIFLAKFKGEFPWHSHADTDDLFLVISGEIEIRLRDKTVTMGPGELFVVPKGVEHSPYAREEAEVLLIEPAGEPNTGDAGNATPKVWL